MIPVALYVYAHVGRSPRSCWFLLGDFPPGYNPDPPSDAISIDLSTWMSAGWLLGRLGGLRATSTDRRGGTRCSRFSFDHFMCRRKVSRAFSIAVQRKVLLRECCRGGAFAEHTVSEISAPWFSSQSLCNAKMHIFKPVSDQCTIDRRKSVCIFWKFAIAILQNANLLNYNC